MAIAIIANALWKLGRKAIKGKFGVALAVVNVVLSLLGLHELLLLIISGLLALTKKLGTKIFNPNKTLSFAPFPLLLSLPVGATNYSLLSLFLFFLKVGSVLYGTGYVLVVFIRADLVDRLGWLTDQQLLDAIASVRLHQALYPPPSPLSVIY